MSELVASLREAAHLAEQITTNSDDTYIGIRLRSYGFLVEARKEVGVGGRMLNMNRQVHWTDIELAKINALLVAVESLRDWAASQKEPVT